MLEILQIPALSDNYIYLVHDADTGATAAVDPACSEPVLEALTHKGWRLDYILNTHHHWDHVGGNAVLKQATGCKIAASHIDRERIPDLDISLNDGDILKLGCAQAEIINTPGHTLGHIVYYFAEDKALFCGDTLFAMGCGRLFEGTAEQMQQSLNKLRVLAWDCRIYCAHEYTQANGRFALSVEPGNLVLQQRMQNVERMRAEGKPTVPSILAEELATNPFLRWDSSELQKNIDRQGDTPSEVFAEIRRRKDRF
ncbi:MAG: hydroxyacylglutathione hydrolase [Gammaproteobacteria bacterium]